MCAQLSPIRGHASSGVRVAPLPNDNVVVFGQWIDKVGLENLLQVQPKQVAHSGIRELIQVLQGTKIHLVHPMDSDSDTSAMDISHHSLPQGGSLASPLALGLGGPSDLEEGEIADHSRPSEPMDQSDTLGHEVYSADGTVSDASAAPSRTSDFQSEDMDTTAQPSEIESHSDQPMTSQDAHFRHSGADSDCGEGESEASRHRRQYPKILPYLIPTEEQVQNRWCEGRT